jgi:transcription elongation factor
MADPAPPELRPGDVVRSLAGRDRGTVGVVWGILSSHRVAVVDGAVHPLAKPKAKNRRHLEVLGQDGDLAHRIASGRRISDGEICAALRAWQDQDGAKGGSEDG